MIHSRIVAPLIALTLLSACQHSLPSYLIDQGLQQGALYLRAQPIDDLLKDPTLTQKLKSQLLLSKQILHFAETDLNMKTHGNYRSYVDVGPDAVSYVVNAAYKDRLQAYLFHYPIFGNLPYRGYFKKQQALDYAAYLERTLNLDTSVRLVPAYSTTGLLKDPLVSSITQDSSELIEVMLHELVHLQFYFKGEADFNEAFATWFSRKESIHFVEQTPALSDLKNSLLKSFAESEHRYQKLQSILGHIKTYFSQTRSESDKDAYYVQLQQQLAKDADLSKLSKRKWNHAISTSFGTYLSLIPKIEAYATAKSLSPTQFLELLESDKGPNVATLIGQKSL